MGFACFMNSMIGRGVRIGLGVVLLVAGLVLATPVGYVLAVIGLVPLAAGLFDFCVFAKLLHIPYKGSEIRARCDAQGR